MRRTATYSRKAKRPRADDVAGPTSPKRPRLGSNDAPAMTSSSPPPDGHNFWTSSSPAAHSISPPSSPPPAAASPAKDELPTKPAQPTAALPKRKLRTSRRIITTKERSPLEDVTGSNRQRPLGKNPATRLTQLQIDLGGDVRKKCSGCGMEYIPSNTEDAGLHKAFHARNIQGIYIGSSLSKQGTAGRKTLNGWSNLLQHGDGDDAGRVLVIHRKSSATEKAKAKVALDMVNLELAAASIDDADLWGQVSVLTKAEPATSSPEVALPSSPSADMTNQADRFKVYLYTKGGKCVGLLLAERISQAYKVIEDRSNKDKKEAWRSSSVSVAQIEQPAILGISRVWTCGAHRRRGIASRLLESARRSFIYGMTISKDAVAFSQPSESGKYLAERWFGASTGWKVYMER